MWQQVQRRPGGENQAYYQVVKGLTSGTTHTFQVRAANAHGGSAPGDRDRDTTITAVLTIDGNVRRPAPARQGQLTAGIRALRRNTEHGAWSEQTELTPARHLPPSWMPTRADQRQLSYAYQTGSGTHEKRWSTLRLHVCNTPYDFSRATAAGVSFTEFAGYRWNLPLAARHRAHAAAEPAAEPCGDG